MQLTVNNIGKHYNKQWLFRNVNFSLSEGQSIAVLGKNGSGKSTLLQIIIGMIQASEGTVGLDDKMIENPADYFNLTSPALNMPIEFNIAEIIAYQLKIKKTEISLENFLEQACFTGREAGKPLRYFSSGMLQRLKTAFCLFNNNPIKLLDEPLSNMDKDGEKWYLNCMGNIKKNHIVIVASNYGPEYQFTDNIISL